MLYVNQWEVARQEVTAIESYACCYKKNRSIAIRRFARRSDPNQKDAW